MDVAIICIVSKNVVAGLSIKIYLVYQIIIYLTMGITVSKMADITRIIHGYVRFVPICLDKSDSITS